MMISFNCFFIYLKYLSTEIGIVAPLVGHGGNRAVTRIDGGVGRQEGSQTVQAVDDLHVGAALEVRPSDTHAEEGVAAESHMLRRTVEDTAAGSVARRMDNRQLMGAEGKSIGIAEIAAYGRYIEGQLYAHDVGGLLYHLHHEELVVAMHLGLEAVLSVNDAVAHAMVEVTMGTEQVDGREPLVTDIANDGLLLFWIEGTAVNDDALTTVVADDVAVLGEHIAGECLDGKHG